MAIATEDRRAEVRYRCDLLGQQMCGPGRYEKLIHNLSSNGFGYRDPVPASDVGAPVTMVISTPLGPITMLGRIVHIDRNGFVRVRTDQVDRQRLEQFLISLD